MQLEPTGDPGGSLGATEPAGLPGHLAVVASVADGRALIDGLDDQVRALLLRRAAISRQVQALRQAGGGPRVQHRRENEIIAEYRAALGRPGVGVALAILGLCRGGSPPGG
jgi:chorismate mutase